MPQSLLTKTKYGLEWDELCLGLADRTPSGYEMAGFLLPRVRCATLGFEIELLRSKKRVGLAAEVVKALPQILRMVNFTKMRDGIRHAT